MRRLDAELGKDGQSGTGGNGEEGRDRLGTEEDRCVMKMRKEETGEQVMGRNTVGIVGGGAAGMMAAIAAAESGARVTLLEGNDRLGKKILSTGNGKCNLGNEKLGVEEYYTSSPAFLADCLERFGTAETVSFFQGIGLMMKSRNGYLYPSCEQASAVLDVLRYEVAAAGVEVVTDCKIERIRRNQRTGKIEVHGRGGDFSFHRVVLACGGKAAPRTGSDGSGHELARQLGHSLVPTVPALVQLKCREEYLKSVAGVRADAKLTVFRTGMPVAEERGELQLTEQGISGIPVFQLSRVVNYILAGSGEFAAIGQASERRRHRERENVRAEESSPGAGVEVRIDFLPDYSEEDFRLLCARRELLQGQRTVEEFFTGMLHKKLMLLFVRLAGLRTLEDIAVADRKKVAQVYRLCRDWRVHVVGNNGYDSAQVCAGGVPLDEVTESLESRKAPGVYFAGEILDVDGKCGGYNLQWAWCSGYLAGCAAAEGEV